MTTKRLAWCGLLALTLLGAGCARSPVANFYTLAPVELHLSDAASVAHAVTVGPVTLPELVDRPQFVVRVADNRVEVLEEQRWAEPLKSAIPRLMAQNLSQLLGSDRVHAYGEGTGGDAPLRVVVDIARLDAVPGGFVTVEANWTVRRAKGEKRGGRSVVQEKVAGPGYDRVAAAVSRALAGVSTDIAKAVSAVSAASP